VSSSGDYSGIDSIDKIYIVVIDNVIDYLCHIVLPFCEDVEYLFIATDGVPSKAKMIEQRRRRYAADAQSIIREQIYAKHGKVAPTQLWNRSMISPATDFMKLLDLKLFSAETKARIHQIYPKLKQYIYSGSDVRMEGEHKILSFLRSLALSVKDEKIAVFSPDSDTPVLCLTTDISQVITVIRHNQQENSYDIIDINRFYQEIYSRVGNSAKGVKDISLLFTTFGNDFLPKIPSYDVRFNFEHLFTTYMQVFNKLQKRLISSTQLKINLKFLGEIFYMMSLSEKLRLEINYLSHYNQNLPPAIYMMLEENKLDRRDPLNSFFYLFSTYRYDERYDKYFSKINNVFEFRLFSGMTNRDEYRKILDPIEKEVFAATHRVNPRDFLRLGEVNLINERESYIVEPTGYGSTDYYNEFFNGENIADICKSYVTGLIWVFNRYFLDVENDFVYHYERSPLMREISEVLYSAKSEDFRIPDLRIHFSPIQQLFYITPIPRMLRIIPEKYRNEIPPNILQKFQNELDKLIETDDILDLRGVTFANKGFSRIKFPLNDEQVKSMFKDYPKHNYNFDLQDIDILRNQCCNLANFAQMLGQYLGNNFSDKIVKLQSRCLRTHVLPILNSVM
jgi:5'-3' exonuclease